MPWQSGDPGEVSKQVIRTNGSEILEGGRESLRRARLRRKTRVRSGKSVLLAG